MCYSPRWEGQCGLPPRYLTSEAKSNIEVANHIDLPTLECTFGEYRLWFCIMYAIADVYHIIAWKQEQCLSYNTF